MFCLLMEYVISAEAWWRKRGGDEAAKLLSDLFLCESQSQVELMGHAANNKQMIIPASQQVSTQLPLFSAPEFPAGAFGVVCGS